MILLLDCVLFRVSAHPGAVAAHIVTVRCLHQQFACRAESLQLKTKKATL